MNTDTGKTYYDEEVEKAKARGEPLIEFPHKPYPWCEVCGGNGSVRSWGTTYKYGACPECFPDHEYKAVPFKEHLKRVK